MLDKRASHTAIQFYCKLMKEPTRVEPLIQLAKLWPSFQRLARVRVASSGKHTILLLHCIYDSGKKVCGRGRWVGAMRKMLSKLNLDLASSNWLVFMFTTQNNLSVSFFER